MKKILTIAAKELSAYFRSPLAYIVLVITVTIFNFFFFLILDQNREASLRDMFKLMEFMFIFIAPLLTMKILAEEKRAGTIEFLMTCPLKPSEILFGKYLASLGFMTLLIILTVTYYFILEFFGHPDTAAVLTGYFGVWLEACLFIAVGLFTSSLTKSQTVAAICSYAILFMFYFSLIFIKYAPDAGQKIIQHLSFWYHNENFSAGLLSSADIIYYVSTTLFFLSLSYFSLKGQNE